MRSVCTLRLRRLPLLPYQDVSRLYPGFSPLPSGRCCDVFSEQRPVSVVVFNVVASFLLPEVLCKFRMLQVKES